jgi:hypothetical protein
MVLPLVRYRVLAGGRSRKIKAKIKGTVVRGQAAPDFADAQSGLRLLLVRAREVIE